MRREKRLAGLPDVLVDFDKGVGDWTVLGNDTVNLAAVTTRRVRGSGAMEFDKADGAANTKLAAAYRSVKWNFTENTHPGDLIAWYVYVSDTKDVDYTFIRLGTDATNYVEYRVCVDCLTAGQFAHVHAPLFGYKAIAANGCDFSTITYLVAGVAFRNASDALADIVIDSIELEAGNGHEGSNEEASSAVDGTIYEDDAATPITSPDTVGATPLGLAVPAGAKFLHLRASAAIRFGTNATLSGAANLGYDYLPAYEPSGPIPVLDGTAVYNRIHADTGTCSIWHRWEVRSE